MSGTEPFLAGLPVEFVGSFPDPRHPLSPALPEIAFLGRSNVGKSSLLNALVGRRIARTSGSPGKTQYLNVFRLPTLYLLDLPGYGYARASQAERRRFRRLVEGVLRTRERLAGVVWLLDIRHPPSKDDLAIRDLLRDADRPGIVALTKADKLSQAQRVRALKQRAADLELPLEALVVTSSAKRVGIGELGERIRQLIG